MCHLSLLSLTVSRSHPPPISFLFLFLSYFFSSVTVIAATSTMDQFVCKHHRNYCKIDPAVTNFRRRIFAFDLQPVPGLAHSDESQARTCHPTRHHISISLSSRTRARTRPCTGATTRAPLRRPPHPSSPLSSCQDVWEFTISGWAFLWHQVSRSPVTSPF